MCNLFTLLRFTWKLLSQISVRYDFLYPNRSPIEFKNILYLIIEA